MAIEYRTMIVIPGQTIRQEGPLPVNPFGKNVENPIPEIGRELHIHVSKKSVTLSLDSILSGGPCIVHYEGESEALIPGEQKVYGNKALVIWVVKPDCIQTIFLNADNLFS